MNQIISLFLPSIIGLNQCDKFYNKANTKLEILKRYLILVLFTNIIVYGVVIYIFKQPDFIYTNQFTLKYLVISTVISYLLPAIGKLIGDNISVNLKVKKNEK